MTNLEALILGLIQGLTEFLPISSSGHLVLGKKLLGVETGGAMIEVFLHFGTLLAILLVFRVRIGKVVLSLFRGRLLLSPGKGVRFTDQNLRLFLLILLGSIPAGVLGFLLRREIGALFNSTLFASSALIFTGGVLFATKFSVSRNRDLKISNSLIVGFAQAISLLPGISRSGATIGCGLLLGVERERAVEYSFLLAIPAILAATGLEVGEAVRYQGQRGDSLPIVLGTLSAFVFGYLALRLLLTVVRRGRLSIFSYYCWFVGSLGLVLSLL